MSLRKLPKVDFLLEDSLIKDAVDHYSHAHVVKTIRGVLERQRQSFVKNEPYTTAPSELVQMVLSELDYDYSLKPVINGTGVVIHTNLGRSVLPEEIFYHVKNIATNYSNLEFDLKTGKRGSRYHHLVNILKELTGAEDAHIVNNNAAAVLLVLKALASEKKVVVSRGELVEIGGSFRIPDVMSISGAKLIEVGTTNKTHGYDYERAVDEDTVMLMKVHQSNFYMEGFTSEVDITEMKEIAEKKKVLLYEDMGSGYITGSSVLKDIDLKERLQRVDLLSISGDKLLGSVQAGIILGRKELIEKLKKDQLTRALRVDKLTLSALEASLKIYLERGGKGIPTVDLLERKAEELVEKSEAFITQLQTDQVSIVMGDSLVGGGTLPKVKIKSPKIHLTHENPQAFVDALRSSEIPIIVTLSDNKVVLDLRCVFDRDIPYLIETFNRLEESL